MKSEVEFLNKNEKQTLAEQRISPIKRNWL